MSALFAAQLVWLFTNDTEVIEIGAYYIKVMALIQWAYVLTAIHVSFLQAVKRPMYGFVEAVARKIILPLGVFYTVVVTLSGSLEQFWYSLAAINVLMTVITVVYAQAVVRRMNDPGLAKAAADR